MFLFNQLVEEFVNKRFTSDDPRFLVVKGQNTLQAQSLG
jgi:hypothetical protein